MINTTATTADSFRNVLAWLRGGDTTPDPVMEDLFIRVIADKVRETLTAAASPAPVQSDEDRLKTAKTRMEHRERIRTLYPEGHPLSLKRLMAEAGDGKTSEGEEKVGSYAEKDLDSYQVAAAINYMGDRDGRNLNNSQIQAILYRAYGTWLSRKHERLFREHPQVWQYGPVFPRAYNKLRKDTSGGKEAYDTLQGTNPDLVDYLERLYGAAAVFCAKSLNAPFIRDGSSWSISKSRSGDRLGVPIDDLLIEAEFIPRNP